MLLLLLFLWLFCLFVCLQVIHSLSNNAEWTKMLFLRHEISGLLNCNNELHQMMQLIIAVLHFHGLILNYGMWPAFPFTGVLAVAFDKSFVTVLKLTFSFLWSMIKCVIYSLISRLFNPPLCSLFPPFNQASQLGVYRAFLDNYELAVETAEKCCQANTQFAEISEVRRRKLGACTPRYQQFIRWRL